MEDVDRGLALVGQTDCGAWPKAATKVTNVSSKEHERCGCCTCEAAYVSDCVTRCIKEVERSVVEVIMSCELADLEFVREIDLVHFSVFEVGVKEEGIRVGGIS